MNSTVQLPTIPCDDPTADSPTRSAEDHTCRTVDLSIRPSDDITDNVVPVDESTYILLELPTNSSDVPISLPTTLPTNPHDDPCTRIDEEPLTSSFGSEI